MKIAICEDCQADIEVLADFLSSYKAAHALDYTVCVYHDGNELTEAVDTDPDIRIIFMDICMSSISGIEAAKAIRQAGNNCSIIFTTESSDYYAESYEIDARHYLVKPLTYERVCEALDRCKDSVLRASRCIEFTFNRLNYQVRVNEIRYIEVLKNTCYIHADQLYPTVSSLDHLLNKLEDKRFIRCHRSYAVNLAHVKAYEKHQIALDDNSTVPVSRLHMDSFKEAYGRYLTTQLTERAML